VLASAWKILKFVYERKNTTTYSKKYIKDLGEQEELAKKKFLNKRKEKNLEMISTPA